MCQICHFGYDSAQFHYLDGVKTLEIHQMLMVRHELFSAHKHGCVAIGNPERHMRRASHCGSKQQQSSHAMITLRVR